MKIRVRHHKKLWQREPEWVESEVEATLDGDTVITPHLWGGVSLRSYFDLATGQYNTWGQGYDRKDGFAYIVPEDLVRLRDDALARRHLAAFRPADE